MDIKSHFESLTLEFESLKDRVRNFIEDAHWLTHGEWRESVLRSFLARHLPDSIGVGRGFVLTANGPSSQCDIILYKKSAPTLFKEGELLFLTPEAVLGIIEVKSRANPTVLREVLAKFSAIGEKLGSDRHHCFFAVFSYAAEFSSETAILDALRDACDHETKIVDFLCLGCSTFVKWWKHSPDHGEQPYERWHAYHLERMAAGYFIANVVDFICPESVRQNSWLWFPEEGKESRKVSDRAYAHTLHQ